MEKRHIIIRLDRIYRILMDKLRINMDNWDEFEITDFYPDLCMIGEWAEEIREEWNNTHPEYIPFELEKFGTADITVKPSAMPTAISVAHQLLSDDNCPDEVRDSLSKFLNVMTCLNNEIDGYQKDHQGRLYGVPKELQTDEALRLLDICVKEDLLDDHYQPKAGTKTFQLSLMAQCIGMVLFNKPSWKIFETLWNIKELKNVYVPRYKDDEKERVLRLFPGVVISKPKQTIQAFKCNRSDRDLLTMFESLQKDGYIDQRANEREWMIICGREDPDGAIKPISWIAELRQLVILVEKLFGDCRNKNIWVKTSNCFEINGKEPNIGSLNSARTWLRKNSTCYDHKLETIIKTTI